ncbi:Tfp pilus assembly protein FimV [Litorivivens lipolytica]|uniref:Tfp pilus assembly protein FimV n=1 Tax=Litorivivens lipolytica TaxID=1524264 RepID=A0A7W4W5H5_9GAMM|nr:LysM peptidoglycan-binding domain-containing protein [Litorivivens lipolytica]MBB3047799.1 Tfp pilus assembly protein FimV [Litorivivens lipolytica]
MRNILKYIMTSSLLFAGGFAQALSLGQPEVLSAPGNPLEVQIPVNNAEELKGQDLRVALISRASPRDALPPETFAGDVRYDRRAKAIVLRSNNVISAPRLSFTLNVRWNEGFLQRAYAIALGNDSSRRAASIISPVTVLPAIVSADETANRHYLVEQGDSLWTIARNVSIGRDGSHEQWMATVYQRNADAFIGGRPDRIRAAYSLDIPQQCSKVRLVLDADGRSFRLIDADGRVVTQQIFSDTRTAITGDVPAPSSVEPIDEPNPAPEEPRVAVYQSKDEIERTYQVVRGETLWGIADRLSSEKEGNRARWMAALFRLNPRAFIAGRPDRLRQDFTLAIPSEAGNMEMRFEENGIDYALVEGEYPDAVDVAEAPVVADAETTTPAAPVVDTPAEDTEASASVDTVDVEAETTEAASVEAESAQPVVAQPQVKTPAEEPASPEPADSGVFEYEGKSFVSDPYADSTDMEEPSTEEAAAIEQPADEEQRLRELEAQLDQALAVIDQEADAAESQPADEDASDMIAELSPSNSIVNALGWITLGMALVIGFGIYRDKRRNNAMVIRDRD